MFHIIFIMSYLVSEVLDHEPPIMSENDQKWNKIMTIVQHQKILQSIRITLLCCFTFSNSTRIAELTAQSPYIYYAYVTLTDLLIDISLLMIAGKNILSKVLY